METSLLEKPEVILVSSRLQVDRFAIVGRLHKLWSWFDTHSEDGHAKGVTTEFIDELVCLPGFADALRNVDWLEARSGSLSIPHFSRHNGQSAKKRAQSRNRQQKCRNTTQSVPVKAPEEKRHAPGVTTASLEKRRKEKRKNPQSPQGGLDAEDPDLQKAIAGIQSLQASWSSQLTQPEMAAINREIAVFNDLPWDLVRDWLESGPEKPPSNRLEFLETGGISTRTRAVKWREETTPKTLPGDPAWLPENWKSVTTEITGTDCAHYPSYRSWCDANPLDRGDLEGRCRESVKPNS